MTDQDQQFDALDTKYQTIPLDEPLIVSLFIERLFDLNLDWFKTVQSLLPHLSKGAAFKVSSSLQESEQMDKAIGEYVRALSNNEKGLALLLHKARKLADNAETGAVKATALNILGKAYITERTHVEDEVHVRVSNLPSIVSGITGLPLGVPTEAKKKEDVN